MYGISIDVVSFLQYALFSYSLFGEQLINLIQKSKAINMKPDHIDR